MSGRFQRWQRIQEVITSPLVSRNLAGESRVWLNSLRQVVEVAMFTDGSVLLTGESGTGKELIARLIHTLDPNRSGSNLVVVDCTTIVPELSGSEFFGHERGAFTGAVAPRDGAFAIADGGTLFLDEVGELPLTLQAELLRVVQERTYKRVGSNKWQKTDFRLICATNRDLLEQERRGEFRRDFYHRIATWTCQLPPLRDRVEDILPLTRHFLQKLCRNTTAPELDGVVRDYLLQRDYSGNVRELLQLVTRIACRYQGSGRITAGDIPESERPNFNGDFEDWRDENFERSIRRALSLGASLKSITDATIETAEELAIKEADDNNARAAQKLGINERTLQMHRAARRQRPG
jgi:transcriptional regulator with GAF, ATPase, and Fis domain